MYFISLLKYDKSLSRENVVRETERQGRSRLTVNSSIMKYADADGLNVSREYITASARPLTSASTCAILNIETNKQMMNFMDIFYYKVFTSGHETSLTDYSYREKTVSRCFNDLWILLQAGDIIKSSITLSFHFLGFCTSLLQMSIFILLFGRINSSVVEFKISMSLCYEIGCLNELFMTNVTRKF